MTHTHKSLVLWFLITVTGFNFLHAQTGLPRRAIALNNVTVESLKSKPLPADAIVDSLCLIKSKRQLWVFQKGKPLKIYQVALGTNPTGAKQFRGDGKTPEGHYYITDRTNKSKFYMSLGISYPNAQDTKFAASKGKSTGGDIRIHGWPNGYTEKDAKYLIPDWTLGCIAVTNKEIEELYRAVVIGSPILLLP